jgi:serine protease Do
MTDFDMNMNNTEESYKANIDESEPAEPTKSEDRSVYGVIYTPESEGIGYVSRNYDSVNAGSDNNDYVNGLSQKQKKSKKTVKTVLLLTGILVLALAISAASSFAAAIIVKEHYEKMISDINTQVSGSEKNSDEDHFVFIDNSAPNFTVQNPEPGELLSMEQAIAKVKDSVVEITTERLQSGFGSFSQYVVSGAGSGVIISTDGYIITNNHVIEGASNIMVRLTNGKEYNATLIATDSKTDIAVISIEPDQKEKLSPAIIGSSQNLMLGQTVIAIGNPLGKLGGTVSDGIISCLAREIAVEGSGTISLLQTNAAVSPGNSGGGLFDLYGRLIGIVNAKSTGQGVEGISFAIPIDTAWDVAGQLINKGYVSGRPSLGITIKQVQHGYSIFGEYYYQLVVAEAEDDSELKVNDIIYSIDNVEVVSLTDVSDILSTKKIGDKVIITVRRDRKFIEVEVTLVEYSPKIIGEK